MSGVAAGSAFRWYGRDGSTGGWLEPLRKWLFSRRQRNAAGLETMRSAEVSVVQGSTNLRSAGAVTDLHRKALDLVSDGAARILLDLSNVTEADCTLVGAVVDILRRARQQQVTFTLKASARVHAWLDVCGAAEFLRRAKVLD